MTTKEREYELEKIVKPILKEIKELYLDKVEKLIDEEDGESFWIKKDYIPGRDIDAGELLLNSVAKIYRVAGVRNTNSRYRKMSRMVAHIRMGFLPKSLTEMLTELEENLNGQENLRTTT